MSNGLWNKTLTPYILAIKDVVLRLYLMTSSVKCSSASVSQFFNEMNGFMSHSPFVKQLTKNTK